MSCRSPNGVDVPPEPGPTAEPPHVLYAGRLAPEKGIEEFLRATEGLPRVVVGAGPIAVPEATGFVPPSEIGAYYDRAAVVCVPSRREGVGFTALNAMAHGRPVVATPVGGLVDAVDDGVTGLLVDRRGLRAAITRLLDDADLRRHLGDAARARAVERHSWEPATEALVRVYSAAHVDPHGASPRAGDTGPRAHAVARAARQRRDRRRPPARRSSSTRITSASVSEPVWKRSTAVSTSGPATRRSREERDDRVVGDDELVRGRDARQVRPPRPRAPAPRRSGPRRSAAAAGRSRRREASASAVSP